MAANCNPMQKTEQAANPSHAERCDIRRQKKAGDGDVCRTSPEEWRRRESNLTPDSSNGLYGSSLENRAPGQSVQQSVPENAAADHSCLQLSRATPDLIRLCTSWGTLPPHIREAIVALLDGWEYSCLLAQTRERGSATLKATNGTVTHETAK
jgi:hypothetical protein